MSKPENVLIVGGGFAGVKAALELADDERFRVTLISDDNDMRYYPTLYRTATGGDRSNSSIPLATIFAGVNIDIVYGKAVTLDRKAKTVTLESGESYPYDNLILALGVMTNYFNIAGLAELSFGIKSQTEAVEFKTHLHKQLVDEHKADLNYIIVGAGPTGIELAGALPSYLQQIMKNHGIKQKKIHIDLIEAMPRLLPALPKATSRQVRRRIKKLGIRLYMNSKVEGENSDGLTVNGRPLKSHTVVWTAGISNNPFFQNNGFTLMGRGKVGVNAFLQSEDGIYVLGDNCNTPYSGLAQTALYDGKFVAENLKRKISGKTLKNYNPKKPITVIPVGPKWAAVLWGNFKLHGFIGYMLREAADLSGFHDLESWPNATKQFLSEFMYDDDCEVCATASAK
jgi:NADH dehydrogenase